MHDVGALTQMLAARKITPVRFSVDLPANDIANGIFASYRAEVQRRNKPLIFDPDTKARILEVAQWLADPNGKQGLMLQGLYGNGKTTMLLAVCGLVNLLFDSALSTERVTFRLIEAKEVARLGSRDDCRKEYARLAEEPLLAIDDLGEEPSEIIAYGMAYTPVKDLLLERYKRQKLTMVSTNLINTPAHPQLANHYGARVVDRFREMMKIITFTNQSYRTR